jgi:hypothetical protein
VRTASSAVREQRIAWKQKDGKELCEVYLKLRRFGQRYPADPAIKSSLQALERRVEEVRKELHGSSGWGKKIVLTLGLTFLSACTVRYWIDKLEPLIEDYAIQQQANAQPDIPSQYSLQRPLPFEEKSDRGEARSGRGAPAAGEASGIEGTLGGAQ